MIRNYFKVAIRNLLASKGFTLINVAGLAVGIACCLLITLFVRDELSFDKHYDKSERTYRATARVVTGGVERRWAFLITNIFKGLIETLPEIEGYTSFNRVKTNQQTIIVGDRTFEQTPGILLADSTFLKVFNQKFIHGDIEALSGPNKVVIKENMANRLFGSTDVIGEFIEIENIGNLEVSAVIEDVQHNSHFDFDILVSMYTIPDYLQTGTFWAYSYMVFSPGFDIKVIEKKIPELVQPYIDQVFKGGSTDYNVVLQALEDIHLKSKVNYELGVNGERSYVIAFSIIAVFILIIACLNFMNLSTAKSTHRSKEVGLRKVFGSKRDQLISQFLGESTILSFLSVLIAFGIVALVMPFFNQLTDKSLEIETFLNFNILLLIIGIVIFIGILAGLYPAFHISSFSPISALRGSKTTGIGNSGLRKFLVVLQFSISITLIVSTLVVLNQIDFMKNQNLGFDKDRILVLPMEKGQSWAVYKRLKNELKSLPDIANASFSASIPGRRQNRANMTLGHNQKDDSFIFHSVYVDFDYLDTYGISVTEGRNFSGQLVTDTTNFLVNEATSKKFGQESILGKKLMFPGGRVKGEVIGVVSDIYFKTLKEEVEPMIITGLTSQLPFDVNYLSIRLNDNENLTSTLKDIETKWYKVYPDKSFNYFFLNQDLENQYSTEKRMSQILIIFSFLAVFVACLGLFGLTTYMTRQRIKEIGIRKVLGASVNSLILYLSKQFTTWMLLANVLAWTSAYFLMNDWASNFAHRAPIPWSAFLISTLLSLMIAWLTIFHQTRSAATSNPIKALRHE